MIDYVWPEPNSSAAGTRLYRQQGWQVEFTTPAQPSDHMIDLACEGISSKNITLNCDRSDS